MCFVLEWGGRNPKLGGFRRVCHFWIPDPFKRGRNGGVSWGRGGGFFCSRAQKGPFLLGWGKKRGVDGDYAKVGLTRHGGVALGHIWLNVRVFL